MKSYWIRIILNRYILSLNGTQLQSLKVRVDLKVMAMKWVLHIPQSSWDWSLIIRRSLVSYPRYSFYLTHRLDPSSTTTPDQSWPGINDNEMILLILQWGFTIIFISRTHSFFRAWGANFSIGDTISKD